MLSEKSKNCSFLLYGDVLELVAFREDHQSVVRSSSHQGRSSVLVFAEYMPGYSGSRSGSKTFEMLAALFCLRGYYKQVPFSFYVYFFQSIVSLILLRGNLS